MTLTDQIILTQEINNLVSDAARTLTLAKIQWLVPGEQGRAQINESEARDNLKRAKILIETILSEKL